MAKTLLNAVNDVLYKVRILQNTSPLTTLTDSALQIYISLAIESWNAAIDELYSYSAVPKPSAMAEDTITIATGDRDYALATGVTTLYFPLINETTGHIIEEYPGGFWELIKSQPIPSSRTGQATYAVIRPDDEELYLDSIPTAAENGDVYRYRYDTDLAMSVASDTVPFDDVIYRAMVPVVAELWRRDRNQGFDAVLFKASLGRASRFLTKTAPRTSYRPSQIGTSGSRTDPFTP